MKNILILANSSVGLYKFRLELIEELLRLNYTVYFSLPQDVDDKYVNIIKNIGAKYFQIKFNRNKVDIFNDFKLLWKYIALINKIRPDVVFTYTIKPNIYGSIASGLFKIPVFINITGLGNSFSKKILRNFIIFLYRVACSKAKYVFFQNNYNKELFLTKSIVKPSKVIMIPGSGVNLKKFIPYEKDYENTSIKFVFIGRIMKEKGIDLYLNVAEKITVKYTNVKFYIVGDVENSKYSHIVNSIKNQRIEYVGFVYDIQEFMKTKKIDCIIHPSYNEGMSNVLLEAAAMGIPIIASNVHGCKEVVVDQKNGFLVNPGDEDDLYKKVEMFIKLESSIKREMGVYSRRIVEKYFDRNLVIDTYIKCINNL